MLHRLAVIVATVFLATSVAALTGCTDATEPQAVPSPHIPTSSPTTPTTQTSEPTPVCSRANGIVAKAQPLDLGLFTSIVDMGPREGANGTVNYADDGTPASYVVAPDDFTDAILDRLCIDPYALDALNAVRRGSVSSIDPTQQAYLTPLYAGDTLNLDPHTITSVGDVNGEVRSYETSFILPPQE